MSSPLALQQTAATPRILVPDVPSLVMAGTRFYCLTTDGELTTLTAAEALNVARQQTPIVVNAQRIAHRLNTERFTAYDLLELFAFTRPGQFCVPTPRGLAQALSLFEPEKPEDECLSLRDITRHLLTDFAAPGRPEKSNAAGLAALMGGFGDDTKTNHSPGWLWSTPVLAALGRDENNITRGEIKSSLRIWDKLPEWSTHAPDPPGGHMGVTDEEVDRRLHDFLSRQKKEERPEQKIYAQSLLPGFAPRQTPDTTSIVLAESGTGVGKTIGYLSPATLWAEKNQAPVWISTYTRNLQRQIDSELDRLYDDPVTKQQKVVTRKGRENYLCLLNLEDTAQSPGLHANTLNVVALGLMTRWAAVTTDGDMAGKDFPGWLTGLLGWHRTYGFADRRGECVYSACPHFNKCFVEKSIRKARRADIVIANHALVMHQAGLNNDGDALPARYVFDEGHHIFDAADSAFGAHLSGLETADLRRWILGVETGKKSRARGLKRRLEDLVIDDDAAQKELQDLIEAAHGLPGQDWRKRLSEEAPKGVVEKFLTLCRQQVLARNKNIDTPYSIECDTQPPIDGLFETAYALALRLRDLQRPMQNLASWLRDKLVRDAETLDSDTRARLTFLSGSLRQRSESVVGAWIDMLESLKNGKKEGFVDWMEITRIDGRDDNVGLYRAYIDPVKIFAERLKPHAHGVIMTSATLRDVSEDDPSGWQSAVGRTGARIFDSEGQATTLFAMASPFDYAAQTRILVVSDVDKKNPDAVAAAYRVLFKAAGGGALGLFTSIQRLAETHKRLTHPLEDEHIPLYAQHTDPLDTGTLIDIFRAEEKACLLGTDATRDGIDVPGRSLHLVVYDRVPWPRPTLLHKARRQAFGKGYDDMLTRFKLKQAYGRLIRRAGDKGVFIMLDGALPSRLTSAFPPGVTVERVGLKEAVEITKGFLAT